MKNICKKTLKLTVLFAFLVSLNSCSEDFLEVTPRGVLVAEETKDYNILLNDNLWLSRPIGQHIIPRSFETCGLEPYFSQGFNETEPKRNNFTWQPNVFDENDDGSALSDLLLVYMNNIYVYNKIINEVLNSSGGSEEEKNSIMAEARAGRAAIYFELINLYAQPYNAATAATDLGFPIVTEADVTATDFVRATTQEVYDFIVEDLSISIPLLPTKINQRPRMTKGAAEALLGKVYINMNRYDEALVKFDNAIASFQEDSKIDMYDYNVSTLPGGAHAAGFFGPPIQAPVGNTEIAFTMSSFNFDGANRGAVLLSPEVSSLYGASDFRLNHFFSRKPFPAFPFTPPYAVPGVYRKIGGFYIHRGVRLSNVYLFRAESKARTNDLSGAIADLEFLRRHRMNPIDAPVPAGLNQDDLIKFVIDERTREFAEEGELWYDVRRLWNDPLFQDRKPYVHTLYNANGSVKETFTLTEERLVFRFSDKVMADHPNLENNP